MTDQERKELEEFRRLWNKLNEVNKEKAAQFAEQILLEQKAAREDAT